MTLAAFQLALTDLIASPSLCVEARVDPESALARYDLTPRERRRLAIVVAQPGMSTSCTLYRVNRITPIASYLPLSTALLGDRLLGEAERFWAEGRPEDLQFGPETERFASFLERRLADGELDDPYLLEVLSLELAVNRLRTTPEAERPRSVTVPFEHDPLPLLEALADGRRPGQEPLRGSFAVVVDGASGAIELLDERPPEEHHATALAGETLGAR